MEISDNKHTRVKVVLDFNKDDTDALHKVTMLMCEINEKLEDFLNEDIEEIDLVERYGKANVCDIRYFADLVSEAAKFVNLLETEFCSSVDEIEFELR